MRRFVTRWPFASFGILSALVMFVVGSLNPFGLAGNALVRAIVIPAWVVRSAELAAGLRFVPVPLQVLTLPLLILPFALVDVLLAVWTRRRPRSAGPERHNDR